MDYLVENKLEALADNIAPGIIDKFAQNQIKNILELPKNKNNS